MTGKEALTMLETRCRYFAQDELEIEETYQARDILNKKLDELTKYKRAFEILKEFNDLPPLEEFIYLKEENYYYAEIDEYDDNLETYKTLIYTLGKEEYELLEELMKDAKD